MATVPVFTQLARDAYGGEVQALKVTTTQTKAYTGTAGVIDNAVATGVRVVRVYCTTAAFIKIGVSPTATTSDVPVAAAAAEYFAIGEGEKVSAIQQSAGGNLHVSECVGWAQ